VTAPDAKLDLAERERLMGERPGSELERRLAKLPDGHPSSSGYGDAAVSSERGDDNGEPDRVEPLTDAEWTEHLAEVETKLDKARAAGLATHFQHTIDRRHEVWSAARQLQHNSIIEDIYDSARMVPCDRQAVIAGGLAGAGKTTVLRDYAGIDRSKYLMINPDDIKEELARHDLVPRIDGLSPMEAADLVHEESSHIAKRLAQRAFADGKNVVWDITMSSASSTEKRFEALRAAGYTRVDGIFVDIPPDVSIRRCDERYREGHEQYRNGVGLGGRYLDPDLILAQVDPEWGSQNRRIFEGLKHRFDSWSRFDNSSDGSAPFLVEAAGSADDRRRSVPE
jgi:predicted kinase